jgi:sodium-coupled neutral amino acid transporter 9
MYVGGQRLPTSIHFLVKFRSSKIHNVFDIKPISFNLWIFTNFNTVFPVVVLVFWFWGIFRRCVASTLFSLIVRYVGSISGLAYIFTLPCLVHLVDTKNQGKLSWSRTLIHSFIMLLGVLNLISQFLITEWPYS